MLRTPYACRANKTGTNQFYFRGSGDDYHEPEYLTQQMRGLVSDFRSSESELARVQETLREKSSALQSKKKQSMRMSQLTSADYQIIKEENQLKSDLSTVEQEIKDEAETLAKIKAHCSIQNTAGLQKELVLLNLEMQKAHTLIDDKGQEIEHAKLRNIELTISDKYMMYRELENKLDKVKRKRAALRQIVDDRMNAMNYLKVPVLDSSLEVRTSRTVLQKRVQPRIAEQWQEDRRQRRGEKYSRKIASLIEIIECLNERMSELDMEDSMVDTHELREKYLDRDHGLASEDEYEDEVPAESVLEESEISKADATISVPEEEEDRKGEGQKEEIVTETGLEEKNDQAEE